LGGEEAEAHRSADEHSVRELQKPLHDADLVAHLGAAEHHAEGTDGIVADGGQLSHLALEQQAGVGWQQVRYPLGGGVSAVGGAEGVVHVQIGQCGKPPRQLGIVAGLTGLEAAVLEHQHLPGTELSRQALRLGAHHRRRQRDLRAQQLPQPNRDRSHRKRRIGSLRPPQVRDEHQRRFALAQQLDGRQRGANPRLVLDLSIGERDVEVDADENAPALHGGVPHARLVEAQLVPTAAGFGSSTLAASSTQRFE
jgi:hypothetical protein